MADAFKNTPPKPEKLGAMTERKPLRALCGLPIPGSKEPMPFARAYSMGR